MDIKTADAKQLLEQAIQLQESQKLRDALKLFRAALLKLRGQQNVEYEAYAFDCIGEVLQGMGKERRALVFYAKAFALAQKCGDLEIQGSAAGNRGVVHYLLGQLDEAEHWLNQAIRLFKQLKNTKKIAKHLGDLGLVYSSRSNYKQATRLLNRALKKFQAIDDQLEQAYTLQDLAYVARLDSNLIHSLSFAKRALHLHLQQKNDIGATECYSLIGLIHFNLDQHHLAEEYLLMALKTIESFQAPLHRQHIYSNLAYVYLNLNRKRDASMILREALLLFSEVDNRYEQAKTLEAYGLIQRELGDFEEVFDSLEESLHIRQSLGFVRDIEMSLYNLGMTCIECDLLTESIQYLSDSIELCTAYGWEREQACALNALGVAYDKQKEFELSQHCFETAIGLFRKQGDVEGLWAACLNLGALYENGVNSLEGALLAYHRSVENLMNVRRRMAIDYRIPYVEDKMDVFDRIVAIYFRKKESANAFKFVELSKARAFMESLVNAEIQLTMQLSNHAEKHHLLQPTEVFDLLRSHSL